MKPNSRKSGPGTRESHGHAAVGARSREYRIWVAMLSRCYNDKHESYPQYGGRGIRVCLDWLDSFALFLQDMGPCPSAQHSIDRKDNNGDYTQDNCKWSNKKEQAHNRRDNRWITANGKTQLLVDWAEHLGIPLTTLESRARRGLSDDEIVNTPYEPYMDAAKAKKIAKMYATGKHTLAEVAARHDSTLSAVQAITTGRNHSEATGIVYRDESEKRKYVRIVRTPAFLQKVHKLVQSGKSCREIALALDVSRTAVAKLLTDMEK